jgi:hypothetical protein
MIEMCGGRDATGRIVAGGDGESMDCVLTWT